jgi:hypothetical protein
MLEGYEGKNKTANFFNKYKKKGVWVLTLALALAGAAVTMTACTNNLSSTVKQQESTLGEPKDYVNKMYQYRGTYTGDNSKVGAIVNALKYTDLPVKSIELKTDSAPYGITVNYLVDNRAKYRDLGDIETGWNKNAAVMFSLIPNADEIMFRLDDQYGNFAWAYYNRVNLGEHFRMEYFTYDTLKEAAESMESFTNYLNKVSAVKNSMDFYSEEQKQGLEINKQIYSVIGDDCEITVNSGTEFFVTITEAMIINPPIKELMDQKEKLAQYTGKKLAFMTYNIHNFKTDKYTFYLFVFDGVKMIANVDLKTAEAEQKAIKILIELSK